MKLCKELRLKCSYWAGEGDVAVSEDCNALPALLKADILQDWIGDLERLYWDARHEMRGKSDLHREAIQQQNDPA